jgi:acetylornithine/LysW-gamma-L-lysine aminotransferase
MINTQIDSQTVEQAHTSGAYSKRPLTIVRGAGTMMYDDMGNGYLDMTSGMGVALLGHAHPAVTNAIVHQANTLVTCAEIFYNDQRALVYESLNGLFGAEFGRYFLCNSGAEGIEGALKIARLLTGRTGIVASKRAFHGRTLGALGTTWNAAYREPFTGWTLPTVTHIAYNDIAALDSAITDQTAAVILEAVQGEGGVYVADPEFLREARRLCTERGALLIMDEIQTGLGRTGRWFGYQHADITPDMVVLAKGLAGGVPMGAVAWRTSLGGIESGTHGTTFGGNPLACASAIATINTLQAIDAPARANNLGLLFINELRERNLTGVREIRGLGLMIGLELRGRVSPVVQALQARGILALVAGKTVLRFLPPLIITWDELQQTVAVLADVLAEVGA